MKATTLRNLALGILVATLLTGADGKGCEESGQHPSMPQQPAPPRDPKPPVIGTPNPKEGDPTPHRQVIVRAGEVEAAFLPATIEIHASPVGFMHDDILTGSSSQKWSFEVPVGITVTVYVQLKPARAGSKSGWCSVESGKWRDGPRIINGAWTATCTLVIPA